MAAKRITPEQHLQKLKTDSDTLVGDELKVSLEAALTSKSNVVVEFAAKLVVERDCRVSEQLLVKAYKYFAQDGVDRDKNCRAKTPLMEALTSLGHDEPEFFLEGMKYRQVEPAWGQPVETAANVRGGAAYGLIRCRSASPAATMIALVDLLSDDEPLARVHAAHAIGATGSAAAVPVLRLKALLGDTNFEVLAECFKGLLQNDLTSQIELVSSYLLGEEDLAIEAATALSATKDERAITELIKGCKACDDDRLEAFLVSISLSRLPSAIEFLIDCIKADNFRSLPALNALAPNRFYPDILQQVQDVVNDCGNSELFAAFQELFKT